jgi:hypothetical protein
MILPVDVKTTGATWRLLRQVEPLGVKRVVGRQAEVIDDERPILKEEIEAVEVGWVEADQDEPLRQQMKA